MPSSSQPAGTDAPARLPGSKGTVWLNRDRARRMPKASVILAFDLRARILGEGLEDGAELPSESDLVQETGLGRATVREALRMLEAEGLIRIRRGAQGGIDVARPHISQFNNALAPILTVLGTPLRDLIDLRLMLEPTLAGLAAERASDEQRAYLLELSDREVGGELHREVDFHVLIAECAGNELVRILLMAPHDLLRLHLGANDISDESAREAHEVHRLIAQAVAAGDDKNANWLMRRHLESFQDQIRRLGRLDDEIISRERWLRDGAFMREILQGEWL